MTMEAKPSKQSKAIPSQPRLGCYLGKSLPTNPRLKPTNLALGIRRNPKPSKKQMSL